MVRLFIPESHLFDFLFVMASPSGGHHPKWLPSDSKEKKNKKDGKKGTNP